MQLGSRQDFELASPVVSVRPLRYSPLKIIIVAAAVIAAGLLLSLRSSRWSALLLLAVAFGLIYLGVSGHALLLSLFYSFQAEDEEEIDKYAINDLSYRTEQEQSQQIRKTQHTFIGKVHFVRDGIKYFHFKEELYKVERGVVSAVTEADILAIFQIRDFREYLRQGLSGERMKTSLELFKVQSSCLKPNAWHFIKKRLCEQIQLILGNLFLLCVSCLVAQALLLSISLGIINAAVLGLVLSDESKKVAKFHSRFASFTQKNFLVYRESQSLRVPLSEILVGDIISIERDGPEDEYMTSFRSLLIGNFEVICKEGASREEFIKSPVRETADVKEDRKVRFVIRPLSYIEKATLRGNERLIVMENNSISKFFSLWFQRKSYAEFYPIHKEKVRKAFKLYGYGIALLLTLHLILVLIYQSPINPYTFDVWLAIIASHFLVPAVIHLLFCISHHRHMKQLERLNIEAFGGNLTQAGTVSNILINFSELLELQFQEILYKNLIFDPSNRAFEPDSGTLENGRTYESLLAIILYLSMGYFDQQQNKSTFLRAIYRLFESYFEYQDTLEDTKIIVHKSTNRMWRLISKDLENEDGLRSWRIFYEHQLKYVLTEFNILNEQNFLKYIGTEDQNRMAIYTSLAESLMEEGKKIKLVMFKSFKKETVNVSDSDILDHTEEQFMQIPRKNLEKNMEFAAFIVFDNALKAENKKVIEALRDLRSDNNRIFNLSIYSHNKNENLAGFEHILQSIPIHYSFKSHEKASLVREKMHQGGTIVVGNDFDDIYGELISDLSIRIVASFEEEHKVEHVLLPSDFFIEKMENLQELLSAGMVHAQFKIETIKYVFIVWFWMTFGWVYLGAGSESKKIEASQLWAISLSVLLAFVPSVAKKMLQSAGNMKNYKKYLEVFTFPYAFQLLLSLLISAVIIFVGFDDFCKAEAQSITSTHMLTLRQGHSVASSLSNCLNLPLILSGSACVLAFSIFFGEEGCILNQFQWWRLTAVLLWLALMLIASIPPKLIILCIGIALFLVSLKVLIKFMGPPPAQKSLKQSQNAETEIQ